MTMLDNFELLYKINDGYKVKINVNDLDVMFWKRKGIYWARKNDQEPNIISEISVLRETRRLLDEPSSELRIVEPEMKAYYIQGQRFNEIL